MKNAGALDRYSHARKYPSELVAGDAAVLQSHARPPGPWTLALGPWLVVRSPGFPSPFDPVSEETLTSLNTDSSIRLRAGPDTMEAHHLHTYVLPWEYSAELESKPRHRLLSIWSCCCCCCCYWMNL